MIHRTGDRLGAHLIRRATFVIGRRWRGLDPDMVYAYLRLVAAEMEHLQRDAATARTEAERLRQGLRQWQTRHIGCKFADPPGWSDKPCPQPRQSTGDADPNQPPRNGGHW